MDVTALVVVGIAAPPIVATCALVALVWLVPREERARVIPVIAASVRDVIVRQRRRRPRSADNEQTR